MRYPVAHKGTSMYYVSTKGGGRGSAKCLHLHTGGGGRGHTYVGGFQLLDLTIPRLKSHMIPYKFKSSHWLKLQHSDWRTNLVKDFFLQINFPPMRALEFIMDHKHLLK